MQQLKRLRISMEGEKLVARISLSDGETRSQSTFWCDAKVNLDAKSNEHVLPQVRKDALEKLVKLINAELAQLPV